MIHREKIKLNVLTKMTDRYPKHIIPRDDWNKFKDIINLTLDECEKEISES